MMTTLQIIGTVLLFLAFAFTFLQWSWVALGTLIAVGILDIILAVQKKETISQGIHKWFRQWGDTVAMIILLVLTWIRWGVTGFLFVIMESLSAIYSGMKIKLDYPAKTI